ncbi:hypothetical protein EZMO1_3771 [Endozoicomonas montiporae CL-33]|nr:DMT family transporter [Endozoicomonas montiporae]AMO57721.1 hypothetical protein EZMO1_3771 [Endozoicomonas montiporae CL-33]
MPEGLKYILVSSLAFALMSSCVKLVSTYDIPVLQIVAARAFISLLLSYAVIRRKGIPVLGNNKLLLTLRGVAGVIGLMCIFYALTILPLAEANIIQNLTPVFTAVLAISLLGEKVHRSTIACIALSLIGLVITVKPGLLVNSATDLPATGVIAALFGAVASAIAYTTVKKLSTTEDSSVIVFYFPLIALPVSLTLLGTDIVMPEIEALVLLILIGVLTQLAQICLTNAMRVEAANRVTAYSYIQIIFSMILGGLLFNEIPSVWTWLGGSLIVTGALINVFGNVRKQSQVSDMKTRTT